MDGTVRTVVVSAVAVVLVLAVQPLVSRPRKMSR
jgi:hypothetical protein